MVPSSLPAFIRGHLAPGHSALVPELRLYLASEITPLWQATEGFLAAHNLAPPFWAFSWPGSEALARHITTHPALVRGLRVLDFAAGGGLAALAAARAGAAYVEAADIDPLAGAAISLNAELNNLAVTPRIADLVGHPPEWDIILVGDVCYEAPMTAHIMPWLRACSAKIPVIMGDPGRKYRPQSPGERLATYKVPTSRELEDGDFREVTLFRLTP
ncbi:methyltransferase [Acidocella sp.]|uniref:class I SAM-dependent methyltransferase n=1 Tax=Acidocella sp. TaxID=50710 RepID=UPI002627A22D|nr:50S ribosomal protein L11 methyltransferase [Acidocella sp.]